MGLVSRLSKELDCSQSAVWNNLRQLKRAGLIECGSLQNKGLPVKLNEAGEIVSKALKADVLQSRHAVCDVGLIKRR